MNLALPERYNNRVWFSRVDLAHPTVNNYHDFSFYCLFIYSSYQKCKIKSEMWPHSCRAFFKLVKYEEHDGELTVGRAMTTTTSSIKSESLDGNASNMVVYTMWRSHTTPTSLRYKKI